MTDPQQSPGRWIGVTLAIASCMAVPLWHPQLESAVGQSLVYAVGTIALLLSAAAAIVCWPRPVATSPIPRGQLALWIAGGAVLALAVGYFRASRLLPAMFDGPVSPYRADMLVVIEAGAREFLAGRTPYTTYHIPWPATIPYGPTLWLPFTLPILARTDLRVLTLTAYQFVVSACFLAAAVNASARRGPQSLALACVGTLVALHPNLAGFHAIGHSQVYWPLLIVFCVLLHADRWTAGAAALGLLVSARTPMAALVPVFFIAAYHRGLLTRWTLLAFVAAAVGPFIPFLIAHPRSVHYAMYGSYFETVKRYVWTDTTWAQNTYGATGQLLARGWQAYAELVQVSCLAIVYFLAWRALARSARPEPWMGLALLVFSMTTLWPVIYLYFDVWVLLIAGLIACSAPLPGARLASVATAALAVGAVSFVAVLGAAARHPGASYTIDIGTPPSVPLTGGGFGADESAIEGARTFVWVEGETARVRLPRAGWTAAAVRLDIAPYQGLAGRRQTVAASLNGKRLGLVALNDGWQQISFQAPARDWNYGFNVLNLDLSHAMADPKSGKRLSVAIDRVTVE